MRLNTYCQYMCVETIYTWTQKTAQWMKHMNLFLTCCKDLTEEG